MEGKAKTDELVKYSDDFLGRLPLRHLNTKHDYFEMISLGVDKKGSSFINIPENVNIYDLVGLLELARKYVSEMYNVDEFDNDGTLVNNNDDE